MMWIMYFSIIIGWFFLLLGCSNVTKKATKGEKTTEGVVKEFEIRSKNPLYGSKYRAVIKAGLRKFEIEAYSMPWLIEGEKVLIQMTGKQRVLGNNRLNNKAKLEFIGGVILIALPFIFYVLKIK